MSQSSSRKKGGAPPSEDWLTRYWPTIREYTVSIGIALAIAFFLRFFFVQAFTIPSASMVPTLQIGDYLLVNKLLYGIRVPVSGTRYMSFFEPERGDIIVFVYPVDPNKDFIKRVIGVPGDVIEIRKKQLFRNGEIVDREDEPYAQYGSRPGERDNYGPETVPEGHVFVMGDNRDNSSDSRTWGFVPYENIIGKAFVIYFSWDRSEPTPFWVPWTYGWPRAERVGLLESGGPVAR